MRFVLQFALLVSFASIARGSPDASPKEVSFEEEELGESVTVAPLPDEDRESLMPRRYARQRDPMPKTETLSDPMPRPPKRHGCGACSAANASGARGLFFTLLGSLWLVGRRRPNR